MICHEFGRRQDEIELTASENIVSQALLDVTGSVLTNKYAEGCPGRHYYGGCQHVDEIKGVAMARACSLFKCNFSNVQPNLGSQESQGVLLALAKLGDVILGLSLDSEGSAYPRQIDFARFRRIADQVGAYLMVDMAHFAGLVATGFYPPPFPHAHVVTSLTYKTLRRPRGGIILTQTAAMAKKLILQFPQAFKVVHLCTLLQERQ